MEQNRIGSWMQTFTGRQFWPLDPKEEDLDIEDIAHALAYTVRYGGHVNNYYSVAEHCVLMSDAVSPEHKYWALMHDAAEAYIGDMVRPLKQDMPQFKSIENKIMDLIIKKYGLPGTEAPHEIHAADNRILVDEKDKLLPRTPAPWWHQENNVRRLGVRIQCWDPWTAEAEFLEAFGNFQS